jgi:hypothetical protein
MARGSICLKVDALLQIVLARVNTAQVHADDRDTEVARRAELRNVRADLLEAFVLIARREVTFHDEARDLPVMDLETLEDLVEVILVP